MSLYNKFPLSHFQPELTGRSDSPSGTNTPRVAVVEPPEGASEVADNVRRQQNGELRALDKVLLNSEPFTQGWQSMFSRIRYNSTVPGDIRELMILRVAALEGAAYEWRLHEPVGRNEGLTTEQLILIRDSTFSPFGRNPTPLNEAQLAAVAFTDASTRNAHIPESVFQEFKKHMQTDRQLVEAVLTVAGYNMVARTLIALNVDGASEDSVPIPR